MDDLISRECVLKNLMFDVDREVVRKAPAVDAVEVIHAHWEVGISPNSIVCSGRDGCYEEMKWLKYIEEDFFFGKLPEYCPHCGAKMDRGA